MKDRLKQLLQHLDMSAAEFADSIGVQRSSISHILSGRNNPGLEYIQKILRSYPQVNPDWLVTGNGNMTRESSDGSMQEEVSWMPRKSRNLFSQEDVNVIQQKAEKKPAEEKKTPGKESLAEPYLEKIVLFYSDGTFREYHPGK